MPPKRTTPTGYLRAHQLRKEPTAAEAKLWAYLRRKKLNGVIFRRQHAIGKYIVDFCSLKNKLAIELDGSQHLDLAAYDQERTLYLESQGYKVIRFVTTDSATASRESATSFAPRFQPGAKVSEKE